MEHCWRNVGARAEEYRGVTQKLAEAVRLHIFRRKAPNGFGEQVVERAHPLEHLSHQQRSKILERGVEKIVLGDPVGLFGRVQILFHRLPRTRLDLFEEFEVLFSMSADIDWRCRTFSFFEEHPVTGVKQAQLEVFGRGCAHELVEVVKDLWHQIPRRARVEAETVLLPVSRPATDLVIRLEQGDVVSVFCQERSRREPANTGTNHHSFLSHLSSSVPKPGSARWEVPRPRPTGLTLSSSSLAR